MKSTLEGFNFTYEYTQIKNQETWRLVNWEREKNDGNWTEPLVKDTSYKRQHIIWFNICEMPRLVSFIET
jgi:hypothetical protein